MDEKGSREAGGEEGIYIMYYIHEGLIYLLHISQGGGRTLEAEAGGWAGPPLGLPCGCASR